MPLFRQGGKPGILPGYRSRLEALLGSPVGADGVAFEMAWESVDDARHHLERIPEMKKELQQMKKEVNHRMKEIRDSFGVRRATVRANPLLALAGKKRASQSKAAKREKLRHQQDTALAPYQATRDCIDRALLRLDSLEQQINAWLAKQD